ncbi:hypothetical protein SESBI_38753 [Sesbania bispinosa]|nr:hypothetical protein SESBI_38753 [Sesbania bispinosa]
MDLTWDAIEKGVEEILPSIPNKRTNHSNINCLQFVGADLLACPLQSVDGELLSQDSTCQKVLDGGRGELGRKDGIGFVVIEGKDVLNGPVKSCEGLSDIRGVKDGGPLFIQAGLNEVRKSPNKVGGGQLGKLIDTEGSSHHTGPLCKLVDLEDPSHLDGLRPDDNEEMSERLAQPREGLVVGVATCCAPINTEEGRDLYAGPLHFGLLSNKSLKRTKGIPSLVATEPTIESPSSTMKKESVVVLELAFCCDDVRLTGCVDSKLDLASSHLCDVPIMEVSNFNIAGVHLQKDGKAKRRRGRPRKVTTKKNQVSHSDLPMFSEYLSLDQSPKFVVDKVWEIGCSLGVSCSSCEVDVVNRLAEMEQRDRIAIGRSVA